LLGNYRENEREKSNFDQVLLLIVFSRVLISALRILFNFLETNCFTVIEFLSFVMEFMVEKEYYERQFATLKSFEEVDTLMETDTICEEDDEK